MFPQISVIIPCYKGAKFLPRSVGCTLSQTWANLECIIVDDASPDNTREVAENLMKRDSRVRYVYNTAKKGLAGVRNFGVKHARGQWIQFYDVDDWLYPEKIERQLNYLNTNPSDSNKDVVIYSDFEVTWENADGETERTEARTVGELTNDELLNQIMTWKTGPTMPLHLNSMLFKKTMFQKNGFNENLIAFEEIELFSKLLYKNIPFLYVPMLSMSYRLHETNVTKDHRRFSIGYIQFLEEMRKIDPALVQLSPRIGILINQAMRDGDNEIFNLVISLIKKTNVPFDFRYNNYRINNLLALNLLFFIKNNYVALKRRLALTASQT